MCLLVLFLVVVCGILFKYTISMDTVCIVLALWVIEGNILENGRKK